VTTKVSQRVIRLGDKPLSRGQAAGLLGLVILSLGAWWVLIMVAVAVLRRLLGLIDD
jgi:hypothetical protein